MDGSSMQYKSIIPICTFAGASTNFSISEYDRIRFKSRSTKTDQLVTLAVGASIGLFVGILSPAIPGICVGGMIAAGVGHTVGHVGACIKKQIETKT